MLVGTSVMKYENGNTPAIAPKRFELSRTIRLPKAPV
jgi:hypothetical protein